MASAEHLSALEEAGKRMLAAESLSDSLFEPQLLQQWLNGAGVELPPVNAVRGVPCVSATATISTCRRSHHRLRG